MTSVSSTQLTIGLPVYNGEKYLREALDSLISQDFGDFTLIISDNGSTDGTADIIRDYAARDKRIVPYRQETNIGAVANFRFVFDRCETPYFAWAAADDWMDRDWFAKLMEVATTTRSLSFGVIETVDASGARLPHPADHRKLQFAGPPLLRRLAYFLSPGLLGKANPIYGVFRKEDFGEDVWSSFRSTRLGPDVAALHCLLKSVPILSRTDTRIFKRRHAENEAVRILPAAGRRRKPPFRKTMLPLFLRQSSTLEKLLIILLYPVAALGTVYAKGRYLFLRVAQRLSGRHP